ncbi:hypothetical protein B0H63DRAFT_544977 [Podospora didyma]|uniref:Uncharacterized protein n=1 Tax=Podospora didyma TaxID=330526 RepID=A0AAE0TV32_9PEZI|nr:hypothetical protein B0H63DRAFT_544977 [Podospora didyma]
MADGESPRRKAQVVVAPTRPPVTGQKTVFLAGTTSRTSGPEWRDILTEALSHLPVTIFNPLRHDWDSSWKEDISFSPFREQVEWELDMQEQADLVVKRGNVQIVSQRLGIDFLDAEEDLAGAVTTKIQRLLQEQASDRT